MSTPISGTGDNLDSATRLTLMLEALSKASAELEKTVNVLSDQLSSFNQGLDKTLRDDLQSARDRMDAALRQNQEGLVKDKESIIKALAEFKQAEIEKVILSGKTVRTGLAAQVEDASRALSTTVASKIVGIKEQLAQPEAEMKLKYDELQQNLQTTVVAARKQLADAKVTQDSKLNDASKEFDSKVIQTLANGQQVFDSTYTQKRTELENEGEKVVAELAHKYDEVIGHLEQSYQAGLADVGESNKKSGENLTKVAEEGTRFLAEQDTTFQDSLNGLSGLLNGLYETRLNNLAAQSRTEIVSAAQHAEECLNTTKSELQVCLIEFQRDYVAQFEALHTKLEKTIEEFSKQKDGGALRGLKEGRVRDQLHSLFRRLGQEMIDSAANASLLLESEFQKSMDAFEQRIQNAKSQACDSLGRESSLMGKELTRSFEEFDKQLLELQVQANKLEKAGKDAANFVMTIRQANLDF